MKRLYGICLLLSVFLYSCEVNVPQKSQEQGRNEAKITLRPTEIPEETEVMEPTAEPYDIIEKRNIKIKGRRYKYAAYIQTVSGKIMLMSLKTEEDVLYIPSEIEGNPVVLVGRPGEEGYQWSNQIDTNKPEWNLGKKKRPLKRVIFEEGIERMDDFGGVVADEIIIPKSMREIEDSAFYKAQIKRVLVRSSQVNLGSRAFYGSTLEQIRLPDDFKGMIGTDCFNSSNLEEFWWPAYGRQQITDISPSVFQECKKLERVVFPENQECIYIPKNAFWQCTKLRELVFPASTKKVVYSESYYADNFKHGVDTLIFKGKDTQLEGGDIHLVAQIAYTPEHFLSVSKIIAPKDSEAIRFAKKAVKISYMKDWKPDEATCENHLDFQKIPKKHLVPVDYEIRNE